MTSPIATAAHAAAPLPALRPPAAAARSRRLERHSERRGMPEAAPALVVDAVHKSFGAGVSGCRAVARVLTGASLRVAGGEVVGIAGGPGSGKSTLLLCAAGYLRPEHGRVSWPTAHGGRIHAALCQPLYLSVRGTAQLREVELALADGVRLVIIDHASPALLHELRGTIGNYLDRYAAAVIVASRSRSELARVASRVLELRDGSLHATGSCSALPAPQRNRSAARASSESPAALARARIRSTCGRSVFSPQ